MPKALYDKPVRLLLKDMIDDLGLQPGQVFTTTHAVEWFAKKYDKVRRTNIPPHLIQASTNDRTRLHYSPKASDDLLFKVGPGQFRLYEPGKDPAPIHETVEEETALESQAADTSEDEGDDAKPGSSEFLIEQDLQRYLVENLECIEPGLKLYVDDDGTRGVEFGAGGARRIDILATDKTGAFVVIELKVSKGYDRVVGQLLRYTNWVRQNLAAPGQRVRGLVVCRTMSEDIRLACADIKDIELYEYQLSVKVTKVAAANLQKQGGT